MNQDSELFPAHSKACEVTEPHYDSGNTFPPTRYMTALPSIQFEIKILASIFPCTLLCTYPSVFPDATLWVTAEEQLQAPCPKRGAFCANCNALLPAHRSHWGSGEITHSLLCLTTDYYKSSWKKHFNAHNMKEARCLPIYVFSNSFRRWGREP